MNMIVTNTADLQAFLLTVDKTLEFDVETTGLKATDTLTSIQLGNGEQEIFIPLNQEGCIPEKEVISSLKPEFESHKATKVAHNLKFDARVLRRYGIRVNAPYFDTLIATALVYPDLRRKAGRGWKDKYALKALMQHFFELDTPNWKEFLRQHKIKVETVDKKGRPRVKKVTPRSLAELPLETQSEYAVGDILYTRRLKELIAPRMGENEKWLFNNIEMPLLPILLDMEVTGIKVDRKLIEEKIPLYQARKEEIEKQIFKEAGKTFDLLKNDEIRHVLLYGLKEPIPLYKKTRKSDVLSVDSEAFTPLAKEYPILQWIMDWRKYYKLLHTYCLPYLELVDKKNRLHSEFGITATGRLSCADPNLQNIPKQDMEGKEIRECFIPDEGYAFGCIDYSQMEYAMVAHYSGDETLCELIKIQADLHTRTALIAFGDEERRADGKTINFATLFGQSASTLAASLGTGYWDARKIQDSILNDYPRVKEWFYGTKEAIRLTGLARTLMGRTRNLNQATSSDYQKEFMGLNTPIQGSCAELVKLAMIRWNKIKKELGLKTRLVLQVHDELVFEIPKEEIGKVEDILRGICESVGISEKVILRVPLWVKYEEKDISWGQE